VLIVDEAGMVSGRQMEGRLRSRSDSRPAFSSPVTLGIFKG
jgi:hypothetical protein